MLLQVSNQARQCIIEHSFAHEITLTFGIDLGNWSRITDHRYSSTFLTISRIWNARPLTFEKGTALTRNFARIMVHSWPRFISGMITVSKPERTSPRFLGKGFRWRRCALETDLPSFCIFSTAEVIEP